MKPLRYLALWVSLVILLLIGLNGLLSGLWTIRINPVLSFLPTRLTDVRPFIHRLYWLIAFLMPALYMVLVVWSWRQRPGPLRLRTATGDNLLIHPGAILKIVRLQIENHPAVVAQKLWVRQAGGRSVAVRAMITIRPITSLPQIKSELESAIRDGLTQIIGVEKVEDIQIVLNLDDKDIAYKPGSAAKAQPVPEPPLRSTEAVGTIDEPAEPARESAEPAKDSTEPDTIILKPYDQP
jgi:hypothetical protein